MSAYVTAVRHTRARLAADLALVGLVAGRIYEGLAPEKATYPLVLIQGYTDPVDTSAQDGRVLTQVELTVRAYSSAPESQGGSLADVAPIADRIDAALDRTTGTYSGGRVSSCRRVAEMSDTRKESGRVIRSLGGRYRLDVAPGV